MRFLRLTIYCVVLDETGGVLLSRPNALHAWNLPNGRLETGEPLEDSAARVTYETTGLNVEITRAVGLYFRHELSEVAVVFAGKEKQLNGEIAIQHTYRGKSSYQYFMPAECPPEHLLTEMVQDALAMSRPMPHLSTMLSEPFFKQRWPLHKHPIQNPLRNYHIQNLLRGRSEARGTRFDVWATGIIWHDQRVLSVSNRRMRALPRIYCDNNAAPWEQLAAATRHYCDMPLEFQWVGYWQDLTTNSLEFIFAARVPEAIETHNGAAWTPAQNAALNDRDAAYIARTMLDYHHAPVWSMTPHDTPVLVISI